jgi:hypothetical protein
MPPTIRRLLTEMPKKLKSNCPEMANAIITIAEIMDAFLAIWVLCWSVKSAVMVINTGIVPNGFMRVKKEVKHKRPNAMVSFMD